MKLTYDAQVEQELARGLSLLEFVDLVFAFGSRVREALREYHDLQPQRDLDYEARQKTLERGQPDGGPGDLLAQARRAARLLGQAQPGQADNPSDPE